MEYVLWIVFIAVMLIIEASTVNLITIWFAVGALGAIAAKGLGAGLLWQVAVLLFVSGTALLIARPIIKKQRNINLTATNADMVIGKLGIVTEAITADKFAGEVTVAGKKWSAVSENGDEYCEGTKVIVKAISGVKIVVAKA